MAKESTGQDRNFDDLAKRFKKNIYGGLKGDIRLAVLERDCAAYLHIAPFNISAECWTILDAGGGQGHSVPAGVHPGADGSGAGRGPRRLGRPQRRARDGRRVAGTPDG